MNGVYVWDVWLEVIEKIKGKLKFLGEIKKRFCRIFIKEEIIRLILSYFIENMSEFKVQNLAKWIIKTFSFSLGN